MLWSMCFIGLAPSPMAGVGADGLYIAPRKGGFHRGECSTVVRILLQGYEMKGQILPVLLP